MQKTPVAIAQFPGASNDATEHLLKLLPEMTKQLSAADQVILKIDLEERKSAEQSHRTNLQLLEMLCSSLTSRTIGTLFFEDDRESGWKMWRRIRSIVLEKLRGRIRGKTYNEFRELYRTIMECRMVQDLVFPESCDAQGHPIISFNEIGFETKIDVYREGNYSELAARMGARLCYPESSVYVKSISTTGTFLDQPWISTIIADANQVVSVPTMRAIKGQVLHGAIRNLFSIVPTAMREPYEKISDMSDMRAELYVDVFASIKHRPCALSDCTANMGIVMASTDCVAHDAVWAHLNGIDPFKVPVIRIAHQAGLGTANLDEIEIRR